MPEENLVQVVFQADTSQMSGAFAKLNSDFGAMSAKGGATGQAFAGLRQEGDATAKRYVNWSQLARDHAAAQEFMAGKVGKTAADFKPATQAMREASVAEEAVAQSAQRAGNGVSGFRGNMRALRIDLFAVVAVLAVLKSALDAYAQSEAASRHLAAQGMGGATGSLAGAAKAQFFDPKEFDEAAISLKVAGAVYGNVTSEVSELGKSARISGVPFKELYETVGSLSEEIQMGGVPSLSELKTLTLASSGATQGLTDRYKELAGALKLTEQGWKLDSEQRQRNYQIAELHASTVTNLSSKMGFGEAAMIQSGLGSLQALNNLGKGGPGEYLGFGSTGSMGGEISKQMTQGMTQLSKETGLASEDLKMFFFYGKLGYSDLTSASQRYQAQKKAESEYQIKQSQEQLRLDTEREQRSLGIAALQQVMSPSAFKDAQAALQKASPEAIGQKLMAEMTAAMQSLGKIVAEHFPQMVVAIKLLGAAMLLSKLAAANARFFPGRLPGGAAAGGAAAEEGGGAAEGGAAVTAGGILAPGLFAASGLLMGPWIKFLDDTFNQGKNANVKGNSMAQIMGQGAGSTPRTIDQILGTPATAIQPGQVAGSSGINSWGTQNAGGALAGDKATVEDPTAHGLLQQLVKLLEGT